MAARPRRIVVGYDGSEASRRALDAAADLVGYGSTLEVVTVRDGAVDRDVGRAARAHLHQRHVEARYHEPSGEPADELVEAAESLSADLVVVGGVRGAVGSRVVRRARCDVLVVR